MFKKPYIWFHFFPYVIWTHESYFYTTVCFLVKFSLVKFTQFLNLIFPSSAYKCCINARLTNSIKAIYKLYKTVEPTGKTHNENELNATLKKQTKRSSTEQISYVFIHFWLYSQKHLPNTALVHLEVLHLVRTAWMKTLTRSPNAEGVRRFPIEIVCACPSVIIDVVSPRSAATKVQQNKRFLQLTPQRELPLTWSESFTPVHS